MNSDYLKACTAAYLRYTKRCPIIAFERGLEYGSNPDVLAVTTSRYLIEVEVKISYSDFVADRKKEKWHPWRQAHIVPRQFYYCAPNELVERCLANWPNKDFGLLTPDTSVSHGLHRIKVVKSAKVCAAKTLTVKQLVETVWHQSGTLVSLARTVNEEHEKIVYLDGLLKKASLPAGKD